MAAQKEAKAAARDEKKVDITKFTKEYFICYCTPTAEQGTFEVIESPTVLVDAIQLLFTHINRPAER